MKLHRKPRQDPNTVTVRISRQLAEHMGDWSNPVQFRMALENDEWQLYVRKADAAIRQQAIAAIAARQ